MQREFNVVIERDIEGYWIASVPALHGCHTQSRSLDELMQRIEEAILLCLEVSMTESGYQSNLTHGEENDENCQDCLLARR